MGEGENAGRSEDARLKAIELFNAHQADLRGRIDTFIKLIFLIAGGSLTISFGVFLRGNGPTFMSEDSFLVKAAWGCLTFSIIGGVLVLFFMILGAHCQAERWRDTLDDGRPVAGKDNHPAWTRVVAWVLGVTSLITLIIGLILLNRVAYSLV